MDAPTDQGTRAENMSPVYRPSSAASAGLCRPHSLPSAPWGSHTQIRVPPPPARWVSVSPRWDRGMGRTALCTSVPPALVLTPAPANGHILSWLQGALWWAHWELVGTQRRNQAGGGPQDQGLPGDKDLQA